MVEQILRFVGKLAARENKASHRNANANANARLAINVELKQTSLTTSEKWMPHRWPSTEAKAAATLAALLVITSFCCMPCAAATHLDNKRLPAGFSMRACLVRPFAAFCQTMKTLFNCCCCSFCCLANRRCQWPVTSCHMHSS